MRAQQKEGQCTLCTLALTGLQLSDLIFNISVLSDPLTVSVLIAEVVS